MDRWAVNNLLPPHIFGNQLDNHNNEEQIQQQIHNPLMFPQQQQQNHISMFPTPLNFNFVGQQQSNELEQQQNQQQPQLPQPLQQIIGERAGQKFGQILQNMIANQFQSVVNLNIIFIKIFF